MSGKIEKKLKRAVKKDNKRVIDEFRSVILKLTFRQRLVFGWKILRKAL